MKQSDASGNLETSPFLQKHSLSIRIWHWLIFMVITSSFISVLLADTLFNQRDNVGLVQNQLKEKGVLVTEDQAFSATRAYEDKVWGVHKILGYTLAFLLICRVAIEILHSKEEKIRSRMKTALDLFKQNSENKSEYKHFLIVKFGYAFFFVLLLFMVSTGLGLAYGRELSFSRELQNLIKELHSAGQFAMYAFVLIHITGVVIADNSKAKGIVSGMINGNKAMLFMLLLFPTLVIAQPKKISTDHINQKWLDVAYASTSQAQKLDIYLPNEGDGPFPVILSIHGGAFKAGDKADGQVNSMLEGLKRGYAVVSINYRLSGEAIFPAQIFDIKAAVRWIRANAKQYKLNPEKIASWGGSAGGHLSAMVGTSGGVKELEDLTQGNADQSCRVQAVVDWFGPTDFLKMDEQLKESKVKNPQIHSVPDSPESELIGKNITDASELVKRVNPETYITFDDPPFFIQHGLIDHLVPYQGSVNLAKKLEQVIGKDKVTLELLPGTDHGGPNYETEQNISKVFAFLDRYLK